LDCSWFDDNPFDFQPFRQAYRISSGRPAHDLKERLRKALINLPLDGFIKPWQQRTIDAKLIIMDMDSTLVQAETIDQIAAHAGLMSEVSAITEAAMRGELDFTQSLTRRVAMLKGISTAQLEQVHARLPLTEGAEELVRSAKDNGCMTVLVSGGFTYFAGPIVERLGIDEMYANELGFDGDVLSGVVNGRVVDAAYKKDTLVRLIAELGLSPAQTIAVGDGANDLLMLAEAGTGIAFHGKPRVQEQADSVINHYGLQAIKWLLGW
jgi:phosphoserine phosphatase